VDRELSCLPSCLPLRVEVSSELMQTHRIADVSVLVLNQSEFDTRRSDCQETLATNRVNGTISVLPVSKRWSRRKGHMWPRSGLFWPRAKFYPSHRRCLFKTEHMFQSVHGGLASSSATRVLIVTNSRWSTIAQTILCSSLSTCVSRESAKHVRVDEQKWVALTGPEILDPNACRLSEKERRGYVV